MEPKKHTVVIKDTPYKKELYEMAPDLFLTCKSLIQQKNKSGGISDIDFKGIEWVIEQIQNA